MPCWRSALVGVSARLGAHVRSKVGGKPAPRHGDGVGAGAESEAERMPALGTFVGRGQEGFPRPVVDELLVGGSVGPRIHFLEVQACMLIEQIDAGARRRRGAAIAGRHGQPATVDLCAILGSRSNLAVFLK